MLYISPQCGHNFRRAFHFFAWSPKSTPAFTSQNAVLTFPARSFYTHAPIRRFLFPQLAPRPICTRSRLPVHFVNLQRFDQNVAGKYLFHICAKSICTLSLIRAYSFRHVPSKIKHRAFYARVWSGRQLNVRAIKRLWHRVSNSSQIPSRVSLAFAHPRSSTRISVTRPCAHFHALTHPCSLIGRIGDRENVLK